MVSENAPRREEENDPSGETIGAEMAKRLRVEIQKHRNTERQASEAFVIGLVLDACG